MNKDLVITILNDAFNTRQLGDTRIKIAEALAELQRDEPEAPVTPVTEPTVPSTVEKAVVYGKGGYTDSGDPRKKNAREHGDNGGMITAMWTTVHVLPETKYRCTNVAIIDEAAAKGQTTITVSVRDKNGQLVTDRVLMATGYQGGIDQFDDLLTSGNGHIPTEHIMADSHSKGGGVCFSPPALGPIAIYVAQDGSDKIASDVIGDLGLPNCHHISVLIELVER